MLQQLERAGQGRLQGWILELSTMSPDLDLAAPT